MPSAAYSRFKALLDDASARARAADSDWSHEPESSPEYTVGAFKKQKVDLMRREPVRHAKRAGAVSSSDSPDFGTW